VGTRHAHPRTVTNTHETGAVALLVALPIAVVRGDHVPVQGGATLVPRNVRVRRLGLAAQPDVRRGRTVAVSANSKVLITLFYIRRKT
jgi:hypothetical protein